MDMKKRLHVFVVLILSFSSLGLSAAVAVDTRVIDVVEVTWPGAAKPPADATAIASVIDKDVNIRWKAYTTLVGDTKDRTINFVSGKVLTTPIALGQRMPCSGTGSDDFMKLVKSEGYKRLGISDFSNRYLVIVSPKSGCVWSGRAPLGDAKSTSGMLVLHDSDSGFVIAHELGHTFGLGHTNFLRCDSGAKDGPWGVDCQAIEYGGAVDVMGNIDTDSTLNTYHQWTMGLLDDSQIKQVWLSETVKLSPSDFSNGVKAIYLRDGKSAYWVEYRRKIPNVNYEAGLAIYRLDPPPVSSLVSPNPEDLSQSEFSQSLGIDVWMVNLDSYTYVLGKTSGSLTNTTAKTYSGNISISAVASADGAEVTINRIADTTPPPVPTLGALNQWRYPDFEIIPHGYEDGETAIASFQAQIDGVVTDLPASVTENWAPTVLNPFKAPPTVHIRDLPEGDYSISIRAIDIAGNKSAWTPAVKITIDRGRPVVTSDFETAGLVDGQYSVKWTGAKDTGSGLCATNLVNEDGFITQKSTAKTAPAFLVSPTNPISTTAQVFDCLGNGLTGDITIKSSIALASKSSRTGKWSAAPAAYGPDAIKCSGKCTATSVLTGKFSIIAGAGSAVVTTGTTTLATIANSTAAKLRIGASLNLNKDRKAIRITGSNFVLLGIATASGSFTNVTNIDRTPPALDTSLTDPKQVALSALGFNATDFSQEWTVLPMSRGTTLDDPSLDLCSSVYPSEKDRMERRQIAVTKPGSPFAFLSTEVVKYSSVAAAQAARSELAKALAQCTLDKGFKDAAGAMIPYTFNALPTIPTGVVAEDSRVFVNAQIDSGPGARQLLGFYQFTGATFTGLYVMTSSETPFTADQVKRWLNVAALMAARLSGKSA